MKKYILKVWNSVLDWLTIFCSTEKQNEKIAEKNAENILKRKQAESYSSYRQRTISAIENELADWGILCETKNYDKIKHLEVKHNSAGIVNVCSLWLTTDKEVVMVINSTNSEKNVFKYESRPAEELVKLIVNWVVITQGKGDLIKGVK